MRRRLGQATALPGKPEIPILDEPANGLDPPGVRWLRDLLRHFAASGGTVLVSSHMLDETARIADDIVLINHGRLIAAAPCTPSPDRRLAQRPNPGKAWRTSSSSSPKRTHNDRLIRSELIKIFTIRTTYVLILAGIGMAFIAVAGLPPKGAESPSALQDELLVAASAGSMAKLTSSAVAIAAVPPPSRSRRGCGGTCPPPPTRA